MDKYTIHCTEEQTKKALELGAPIQLWSEYYHNQEHDFKLEEPIPCKQFTNGYVAASCPTTQQMIGWLEEQGVMCFVGKRLDFPFRAYVRKEERLLFSNFYPSRTEATIAAIDAALNYLKNIKQ